MDNSTRLPLLSLPSLVIDEVLSSMIPFELINLSKASTTCKLIVKSFSKNRIRKNFAIRVSNVEDPVIRFIRNRDYYNLVITDDNEKDGTLESEDEDDYHFEVAYVYSDGEHTMKKFMDVFTDIEKVFNVDIDYCELCLSKFKELYQTILDWLISTLKSTALLSLHLREEPVAVVEHTLNSLTMVKHLQICSPRTTNCAYSIPDHIELLIIYCGEWVKLEHLLSFKASAIYILRSKLTNEDLNVLLKSWMNMESLQQVTSLSINLINPENFDSVLEDIPHQIGHPDRISKCNDPEYEQLNGGFDIQRKDGVVASIFVHRGPEFSLMLMEQVFE